MDNEPHAHKRLTLETAQEETWAELRQFYAKNRASIERSRNVNVAQGQFQEQLEQVLEASQVLLDGLVALANVHPVVGCTFANLARLLVLTNVLTSGRIRISRHDKA